MRTKHLRLVVAVLGLLLLARSRETAAQEPVLVFTHATVIDASGAGARRDMTVTVEQGRITDVRPSTKRRLPPGTRVIDASHKYLIPGLWDMHVHWNDERFLGLFLANGVTGIRVMWGEPQHLKWRAAIANGKLQGPRMIVAGPLLDGPNPVWPDSTIVATAAEARDVVPSIRRDGYDFVKVYSRLPREAYFAIAAEAKRANLAFAGHVPNALTVLEASDAHQKSIEHLDGLLSGVSSVEKEVRERMAALSGVSPAVRAARRELSERMLATFDSAKATALFARFVRNGTWQCPTLTLLRAYASLDDSGFVSDPRLKYMPRSAKSMWQPQNNPFLAGKSAADYEVGRRVLRRLYELVGAMNRAGVPFIAGTDVLNPFVFPGFSLHDELALLVDAGLTPLQALRAATSSAAAFAGRSADLGAVKSGYLADLVLLDRNPLEDIRNTRAISAVVMSGRLYDRAALDRMLADAEKTASLQSLTGRLSDTINAQGVEAAVALYREIEAREKDAYDFSEGELDQLGYDLLFAKKAREAIEMLKLNVDAHPDSASAHDHLAAAYLDHGDRELAIEAYKKSVQLDPANSVSAVKLKKLERADGGR
jgi:imidazolonepropionase-like amidohydrolase